MPYKRYVSVIVFYDLNGSVTPTHVIWESSKGEKYYKIDKILSKKNAASIVGGCGVKFECMIRGKKRNLFLEKDKWFIESEKP